MVHNLPKVLLINYSPSERKEIVQYLLGCGFSCLSPISSLDSQGLLKHFQKKGDKAVTIDLVLVNMHEGPDGGNGGTGNNISKVHLFLRRIRGMNSMASVILTGDPIALDKVSRLLRYGVYDYLCHPISLNRLEKTIRQGLKNKEEAEEIVAALERSNRQHEIEETRLKKWSEALTLIQEISQTLLGCLNIDDLLCSFGEDLKKLLPYGSLSIFLKGHEEPDRAWIWSHPSRSRRDRNLAFLEGLQKRMILWGNRYLLSDTTSLQPIIQKEGAEIVVPLSVMGQKVGVLRMTKDIRKRSALFDRDQANLLSKVIAPFCLTLRNAHLYQRVNTIAATDELTRILNRRAFIYLLEREFKRFNRLHTPIILLLIDLDFFKQVNDQYGHLVGDHVLKEVAAILKHAVREIDILARYGGEEFAVILPEGKMPEGLIVGERIRCFVEAHIFNKEKDPIRITASIGIAMLPSPDAKSAEEFLHLADMALYRAKAKGRNRIECDLSSGERKS